VTTSRRQFIAASAAATIALPLIGAASRANAAPAVASVPPVALPVIHGLPSHVRQIDLHCDHCNRPLGTVLIDDLDGDARAAVCSRCFEDAQNQIEEMGDGDDEEFERDDLKDEIVELQQANKALSRGTNRAHGDLHLLYLDLHAASGTDPKLLRRIEDLRDLLHDALREGAA